MKINKQIINIEEDTKIFDLTMAKKWKTIEDVLLNAPIGTKVVVRNETYIKLNHLFFININNFKIKEIKFFYGLKDISIYISFDNSLKITDKKEILNKEEKEYLKNIIAPFRNKIINITKEIDNNKYEYIRIAYQEESREVICILNFPSFKAGTMYKNMEKEKQYTLEELDLDK